MHAYVRDSDTLTEQQSSMCAVLTVMQSVPQFSKERSEMSSGANEEKKEISHQTPGRLRRGYGTSESNNPIVLEGLIHDETSEKVLLSIWKMMVLPRC